MRSKRALPVAVVSALIGAAIPTLLALRMLADNNNNAELYDIATGEWDVPYALAFSGIFYMPSFLIIFVLVFGLMRPWDADADGS